MSIWKDVHDSLLNEPDRWQMDFDLGLYEHLVRDDGVVVTFDRSISMKKDETWRFHSFLCKPEIIGFPTIWEEKIGKVCWDLKIKKSDDLEKARLNKWENISLDELIEMTKKVSDLKSEPKIQKCSDVPWWKRIFF